MAAVNRSARPGAALIALLAAVAPGVAGATFAVNGVALGGSEADVKQAFPSALCKPLEWKSRAADRRCDDARVAVAGVEARVTVYFLSGAVQGLTLRFESKHTKKIADHLRGAFGPPTAEGDVVIVRRKGEERRALRVRWEKGADRAVLTAHPKAKRATLDLARGDFEEEIYRVR
jgi:hypothetical protein